MRHIRNIIITALLGVALAAAVTAQAQVTPTTVLAAFTNNPTIATAATTLAGTTNHTINIRQNVGMSFQFMAYATNAGSVTFFISRSADGTNYGSALNTYMITRPLVSDAWTYDCTNLPASFLDNQRNLKIVIVSNSAATVYLSNCLFSVH